MTNSLPVMGHLDHALEPIGKYLDDPAMVEVAVNPNGTVWLLRRGDVSMSKADITISSDVAKSIVNLIAGKAHAKTSTEKLLVSASIKYMDWPVRAQGVHAPAAHGGAALSFRMFSSINIDEIKLSYLSDNGSVASSEQHEVRIQKLQQSIKNNNLMETLQLCVDERFNVLISGGTDTGKTVVLRKILSLVSPDDRLVTIEDAIELFPTQPNCVSLIADRSSENRSTDKLLEASLRMRPDRLIVGEIRGKEAMTFLEAINTGHGGSMSTIHAESPDLALDRLAIAAARSGVPMTYENLRNYISRTIDVIIQTGRKDGKRGITEIYCPKLPTRQQRAAGERLQ